MSHVFHRSLRHEYPFAVAGEGVYLYDRNGRRYLDGSGGAAVSCVGHSDRAVIEAIAQQLEALPFAHTSFFSNEPMEALAARLVESAPRPLDKVYFTSGGSEAMEAALKLARQYHVEKGEPQRVHFIGRRQSYHGNTLGALAVGGNAWRRGPYEPLLMRSTHVAPCYPYRDQHAGEPDAAYAERLAAELEREIERLGPRTSLLTWLPGVASYYRYLLPLMPLAAKTLRTGNCDLVVSFSHCVAKSARAPPSSGTSS